jgi:hypothetical protein
VLTILILTGLACGTLLATAGFMLWNSLRLVPGLSHAVQVLGWLAGTLLLLGALLAWLGHHNLSPYAPPLILMAALAAPPQAHHCRHAHWSNALFILPALALAVVGLFWITDHAGPGVDNPTITLAKLAVVICGGFGARALGGALGDMAASIPHVEWPSAATYTLLTLWVGSVTLVSLWQRGSVWGGTAGESALAAVWLAWSAAWVSPHHAPRLRAALTAVAALCLIVLATGYPMLDA